MAGLGVATQAQANPGPLPTWCPGEYWDPGWGNNWDWNGCHDWHREGWGPGGPPPPWGPPPPPPGGPWGPPPPPGWHP
ncbi:hypothetical protein [Mycobacterium sp.]|uniref:hypothetical protein n=1 Tax=Mycobacterium sp. TaxID=1785 RepID=UPI0025E13D27|nr:hypothetical protein [Mycobacterium sp.]